ncbi:hypothetical protein [Methylobacterium sp. 77]|uniref:alpha/beta hydrolase n=1 Tax=Methylobacterium sp. 77 TaxID=1101192 RepID=UPI0003750D0F|nr:hypothetical protein [Methylobacterium sp. 77]
MKRSYHWAIAALIAALPLAPRHAVADEQIATIRPSHGFVFRVLVDTPDKPRGAIVMLPGGDGDVGIARDGGLRHGNNFVVRTRALWLARGYVVLIPDTMSHASLRGARSTLSYGLFVADLVRLAHAQSPGPVFLLGTSQGSIAAMNGASRLGPDQIAGVIMTESVSRMGKSGETVFDASPDRVHVPALIVANERDACAVSPPADADLIASALSASPAVTVLHVRGGASCARPCGSLSPHGYLGMESDLVADIVGWMETATRR